MPAVVGCSLLGFCPSVLQGQPLLWCRAAESRQEAGGRVGTGVPEEAGREMGLSRVDGSHPRCARD